MFRLLDKKKEVAPMTDVSEMSAADFMGKIIGDKKFRQEVVQISTGFVVKKADNEGLIRMLMNSAKEMGAKFSYKELKSEFGSQIDSLSGPRQMKFLADIMKAGQKAKKANK